MHQRDSFVERFFTVASPSSRRRPVMLTYGGNGGERDICAASQYSTIIVIGGKGRFLFVYHVMKSKLPNCCMGCQRGGREGHLLSFVSGFQKAQTRARRNNIFKRVFSRGARDTFEFFRLFCNDRRVGANLGSHLTRNFAHRRFFCASCMLQCYEAFQYRGGRNKSNERGFHLNFLCKGNDHARDLLKQQMGQLPAARQIVLSGGETFLHFLSFTEQTIKAAPTTKVALLPAQQAHQSHLTQNPLPQFDAPLAPPIENRTLPGGFLDRLARRLSFDLSS